MTTDLRASLRLQDETIQHQAQTIRVLREPKAVLTKGACLGADCPSRERLDDAIDAALAQGAGHAG